MSKTSIVLLFATIGLIIIAALYELPFATNGSGVLLVAGLAYAYVVAKRELGALSYALSNPEVFEDEQESRRPAAVPTGFSAE